MDIIATEDGILLQDTARRFLEKQSPVSALRRLVESEAGFDRDVWRQGAELGWCSLFVPEEHGGMAEAAQGVVDAAILAEELGRVVYAGPFLSVNLAAFAIAQAGTPAQRQTLLPGLAAGELFATWCVSGLGVASGIEVGGVRARRSDDGWVIDGACSYVHDGHLSDWLLVTAADATGLSQFLTPSTAPGVAIRPLQTLDLGRVLSEVRFDGVQIGDEALLGAAGAAEALVERQFQLVLALLCAETVGVADRVLEFTLDYVKQRVAFGRPIGSFQALKHRLADHATQLEGAKAASAYAARAVQAGAPDAAIAVSVAKSQCGRAGTDIIRDCLQMHGGIGMTWEHDIHLYLRRAVSNEALWGTPAQHHERLCRLAGLGG